MGESLADPQNYENLFSGYADSLKAEQFLRQLSRLPIPANARAPTNAQRNILEEMVEAEKSGQFSITVVCTNYILHFESEDMFHQ